MLTRAVADLAPFATVCAVRGAIVLDFFFFFQAEDGIRDYKVTGVQTCALPICDDQAGVGGSAGIPQRPMTNRPNEREGERSKANDGLLPSLGLFTSTMMVIGGEIGRASCRERV